MGALAINQQPRQFQPAYNDLIFVLTSPNNTQDNYKYLIDITVGSDVIRLKCFPDPVYGSGVFNIGRILETYVTSDLDVTMYDFQQNTNSFKKYSVAAGEEYGPSSGITEYTAIAISGDLYVWNGWVNYLKFQNYNQSNYISDGQKELSFRSNTFKRKLQFEQDSWIYFNQDSLTSYIRAHITVYNSVGANIRECTIENTFSSGVTDADHFIRFASGTRQLNQCDPILRTDIVGSGGTIIDTNSAIRYEIYFDGDTNSEVYYYEIVDADCRYTTYQLHWLNKLGAFESFNFTKKSAFENSISRSNYKRATGALSDTDSFGYNVSDRGTRTFFTSMKDQLKLKSDWLTDEEMIYLRDLVESPEIYIAIYVDDDGTTYEKIPVICTDSKFTKKTQLNDKCFALELNLEFSFERYSQRD
jgi:hypothetical protein